jgi:hypothetical protein
LRKKLFLLKYTWLDVVVLCWFRVCHSFFSEVEIRYEDRRNRPVQYAENECFLA